MRSRSVQIGVILLALVACSSAERLPIPDEAGISRATKLVQEVYGTEMSRARSAVERVGIARRMLASAIATPGDPAAQYVLLNNARDLSAQGGDPGVASESVRRMGELFDVDTLKLRADLLTVSARGPRTAGESAAVVVHALKASVDSAEVDRFDLAEAMSSLAIAQSGRATDPSLVRRAAAWRSALDEMKAAYARVVPMRQRLAESPADPAASLEVGSYLCLYKGDWPAGVPLLKQANHPDLSAAAGKEMGMTPSSPPTALVDVADTWWDVSQNQRGLPRLRTQRHAAELYRRAAPHLSGLPHDKADRRAAQAMAESDLDIPAIPPLTAPATQASPIAGAIQPPLPPPNPSSVKVAEANSIALDAEKKSPALFQGAQRVELVAYHDATAMRWLGGSSPASYPGTYAVRAIEGARSGVKLSATSEQLPPGRYVVVWRVFGILTAEGNDVYLIELLSNGKVISSNSVDAKELDSNEFTAVPLGVVVNEPTVFEHKFTSNGTFYMIDRVYIFRLH